MQRTAVGRPGSSSSSSASGREPLSEYAHGTTLQSSPSEAAEPATARSASRPGEVSTAQESTVTRRWPSSPRCRRLCWTPRSLSKTTSPGRGDARERVADRDRRDLPGDRGPAAARRPDRHDDQPVDALVDESLRELELPSGLAVGVGDERAQRGAVELPLDGAHELLVPEVAEAADEQPDDGGRAARQRARDRIGLVAQLLRRLAHPRLGLGGDVHAAQRVADRGRREPRVLGQLADRGPVSGHSASVLGLTAPDARAHTAEAVH